MVDDDDDDDDVFVLTCLLVGLSVSKSMRKVKIVWKDKALGQETTD